MTGKHLACRGRGRSCLRACETVAGPGRTIAGLCTVTMICPGDMADQILDRDKHPEWQGRRTKLVSDWPAREDLWT